MLKWNFNRRSLSKIVIIGTALVAILGAIIYFTILVNGEGDLAKKPAIVMLQGLAMDDSANRQAGPIIYKGPEGYIALGLPGVGAPLEDQGSGPVSTRMWILLNDHSASRTIRQINTYQSYDLQCDYVNSLGERVSDMDDYVIEYLKKICR